MATPIPEASDWLTESTLRLALWGAAEWLAGVGLLITLGGLFFAIRSIQSTERAAIDAAKSARALLQHEQSADLMIPFRPGEYDDEIPDGAFLWIVDQTARDGVALVRGRIRNVGRYGAREVSLRVFQGAEALTLWNGPPPYLEPDSFSYPFEFELPLGVETTGTLEEVEAVFPADRPITIVVDYADGNQRNPQEFLGRFWQFRFDGDRPWGNWEAQEEDPLPEIRKRKA